MFLALAGACLAQSTGGVSQVLSAIKECAGEDVVTCLKLKAVRLVDRALVMDTLPVTEYVTVNKNLSAGEVQSSKDEDLEATLPRDLGQRSAAVDKVLMDKLWTYLETRTISLKFPTEEFEGKVLKMLFLRDCSRTKA